MSHPKGVVPEGNLLFSTNANAQLRLRSNGLGRLFYRMTDEQMVEFLSFLDAGSLIHLSMTSRVFHIFCTLDFIWRDVVLTECDRKHQTIDFDSTWRKTYYLMCNKVRGVTQIPDFVNIRVDGLPSGFLFKQWLCGNIRFERDVPNFFKHQDIPIVQAEEMSVERFVNEFERPNLPVIIRNAVNDWPAMQKWRDDDYLKSICENVHKTFRATSAAASQAASFTMPQYLNYASTVKEEAPLYLFERDFAQVPELKQEYTVPKYFRQGLITLDDPEKVNSSYTHQPDLFSVLGEGKRPDYRWLVIGPAKSGSLFHIDPNMTNAWNVSIRGRKKWIFYPPTRVPPGVQRSEDGADVTVPISTSEWLLTFWSYHLEARHDPDVSQRPLEAIAEEGDLFFVPHGWWHMVVNLDFSLALTQNYVSTSNLSDVLRFLRDKRDQVSGVRDRKEAMQPEELYENFVAALKDNSTAATMAPLDGIKKPIPLAQLQAHIAESMIDFDINRDTQAPTIVSDFAKHNTEIHNINDINAQIHYSLRNNNKVNGSAAAIPPAQILQNQSRRRRLMKSRHHYSSGQSLPASATHMNSTKKTKRSEVQDNDSTSEDVLSDTSGSDAPLGKKKKPRNELTAIFADQSPPGSMPVHNIDSDKNTESSTSGFSFSFF